MFTISTRMLTGIAVFTLMARTLDPRSLGLIATVFSFASLGSLISDFGLGYKILRDIAAMPENGAASLGGSLEIKAYLTAILLCFNLPILILIPLSINDTIAAVALVIGVVTASFGDLALISLRATGKFLREAIVATVGSIAYVIFVVIAIYFESTLLSISVAFLLSRVLYALLAIDVTMRGLSGRFRRRQFREVWVGVGESWWWAASNSLSFVNGQVDGMLVAPVLGLEAGGIYQAGSRFAGSAVGFVSAVTNVEVPRLAAGISRGVPLLRLEINAFIKTIVLGLVFAVTLYVSGPIITKYAIGPNYIEVNSMWASFGFLVLIRYMSSAVNTSLVAFEKTKAISVGEAAAILVEVPAILFLSPIYGVHSVPWIMCAGSAATFFVLSFSRIFLCGNER